MAIQLDRSALLQRVGAGTDLPGWRLRAACAGVDGSAASRRRLGLSSVQWLAALPALGDVLYLCNRVGSPTRDEVRPGALVESIELAPLLQWRSLEAVTEITRNGPREWIECLAAEARIAARLYLLPDTDYLAWDALHAGAIPLSCEGPGAGAATWSPARVQLLRFRTRRVGGLEMLGCDSASDISSLSRQLAGRLARDEVA